MKRVILVLLILFSVVFVSSCKKEPLVYSGSVMLYTTLDESKLKDLKELFEKEYKGLVLDYYYGDESKVKRKMDVEFSTGQSNADVVIFNDNTYFDSLKEKEQLLLYESKERKKIKKEYLMDAPYYLTCYKKGEQDVDSLNDAIYAGIISECANMDNAKFFIDFLLSKTGQAFFVANGFESVRK